MNNQLDLTTQLQTNTIAVSLRMSKFGNSRALEKQHKQSVASAIDADADRIKASEVLLNTRHPTYKAVTAHMSSTKSWFTNMTVAFPEPTIRLLALRKLDRFNSDFEQSVQELRSLVAELDQDRDLLVRDARAKLGNAFNESHYPLSFSESFNMEVSFPSIGPDQRLQQLDPELYEAQVNRLRASFDQAIVDTTSALSERLHEVLSSLTERLSEGQTIRRDMLEPLTSFFERFEDVRIGSTGSLQSIVDEARSIISGVNPAELRRYSSVRNSVSDALAPLVDRVSELVQPAVSRAVYV